MWSWILCGPSARGTDKPPASVAYVLHEGAAVLDNNSLEILQSASLILIVVATTLLALFECVTEFSRVCVSLW